MASWRFSGRRWRARTSALRACYAALRMRTNNSRHGDEVQRARGVPIQIRIGINSGDVVVRAIGSDLDMDYTAVGQTTRHWLGGF